MTFDGRPTVIVVIPYLTDIEDYRGSLRNWTKNINVFVKQGFTVNNDNRPEHGEGL